MSRSGNAAECNPLRRLSGGWHGVRVKARTIGTARYSRYYKRYTVDASPRFKDAKRYLHHAVYFKFNILSTS